MKTLYDILPSGTEGGKEFARIVDLLIFHDARRSGRRAVLFDDAAGDFHGLDSFSDGQFRKEASTGYQYKFYPSPLSSAHRKSIEESVQAAAAQPKLVLRRWVLVTPQDLLESARKTGGGDVTWFESLRTKYALGFEVEHWGHKKLLALFLETPTLALFYYPELVDRDQSIRTSIKDTRERYDGNLLAMYRDVQFVGMSIYKPEAARGVAIQDIYIPLTIVPEGMDPGDKSHPRENPLTLLEPGSKHVVLGDPGSGKSTLLRFLALSGLSKALQDRYRAKPDKRLPVIVVLRKYADELKQRADLGLLDYLIQNIQADFSLNSADLSFFSYYLESGQATLLFDGLDELPSHHFKEVVRDRIRSFLLTYPGNTAIVTSRMVGYDDPFRFDNKQFRHFRISALRLQDIEQFVRDWYRVRIDNKAERDRNSSDLLRIIRDEESVAIRQLAENPLLLTIVTLVHRIDAVLPDERVVLYQKCTETLLNTWHTWKFRETEQKNRGRIERRNRARMEAVAHWMQCRSVASGTSARAIAPYDELHQFLTQYITTVERPSSSDSDPQDSATEFLDFVKRRAGLLVETGDKQYSFVHLTFQEYLTATYIITTNEAAGAAGIWQTVSSYWSDARWHEVIRLLMGGLRSPSSQGALLQSLLDSNGGQGQMLAELLGGFVLDGIEPAEERREEILHHVLTAAARSETSEGCRRLVRIVRAWRRRESFHEAMLKSALESWLGDPESAGVVTPLLAVACGAERDWLAELCGNMELDETVGFFIDLFFIGTEVQSAPEGAHGALDRLFKLSALCVVTSQTTDFAAAQMQRVFGRAGYTVAAKYWFQMMLTSLIGGPTGGPFHEFTANTIRLAHPVESTGSGQSRTPKLPIPPDDQRSEALRTRTEQLNKALLLLWRKRDDDSASSQDRPRSSSPLWKGRDYLERRLEAAGGPSLGGRSHSLSHGQNRSARASGDDLHSFHVGNIEVTKLIVDLLSESLELKPSPQWNCALGYSSIFGTPANPWVAEPERLVTLEERFLVHSQDEPDCYCLAWYLLFDVWCYFFDYRRPRVSRTLVNLTKAVDHPALRVANSIRELAMDESVQLSLLSDLTKDPLCRELLQESGWLGDKATSAGRGRRRRASKSRISAPSK